MKLTEYVLVTVGFRDSLLVALEVKLVTFKIVSSDKYFVLSVILPVLPGIELKTPKTIHCLVRSSKSFPGVVKINTWNGQ